MKKELKKFIEKGSGFESQPTILPANQPASQPVANPAVPSDNKPEKMLSARIPADILKQLKLLSINKDKEMRALLLEALIDLFEKYREE